MNYFDHVFFEDRFSDCVLAIPGILPRKLGFEVRVRVGTAFRKTANNGRAYYKLKLDCYKAASGKTLYAKAWSRKLECDMFDFYTDEKDLPIEVAPLIRGLASTGREMHLVF